MARVDMLQTGKKKLRMYKMRQTCTTQVILLTSNMV